MYYQKQQIRIVMVILLLSIPNVSNGQPDSLSLEEQSAITKILAPSLVRVEYTLQYDKGETAELRGWVRLCPNCGAYHPIYDGESIVTEERPLEIAGYLIDATIVASTDPMIQSRFLKTIQVVYDDQIVDAKIHAYAKEQNMMLVKLKKPLPGTKPLVFQPETKGPYYLLSHELLNGTWTTNLQSLGSAKISQTQDGHSFRSLPSDGIIAARDGTVVGLRLMNQLPLDDSWKGSLPNNSFLDVTQMEKLESKIQKIADQALLRTRLNFRSPKKSSRFDRYELMNRYGDDGEEKSTTERNTVSILFAPDMVLILEKLNTKTTARLEKITVFAAQNEPVQARFVGTLKDYGGLIAKLEKSLSAPIVFSAKNIRAYRDRLLPALEVRIQGDKRVTYYQHQRIPQFETGWRRQIFPQLMSERGKRLFLFDEDLQLITLPITKRTKVSEADRWSYNEPKMFASKYLHEVLHNVTDHFDPSIVPLSEAEENRLAWMGVVLQGLNPELARVHKISDLTKNGQSGALVSYVYPDSPAAQAGIEPGAIFLRLHVEDQPKPLEVKFERENIFGANFPWDRLDEVPEQYLADMPSPWPSAENSFTRALTNIGFDKKFILEYIQDEESKKKEFKVAQSPPHYDSAPRYKCESLGMTVRDLTYEVRRYFQKQSDDPGVIVSKIEPGGKASVSGIKPYEIITQINDQPVKTVKDFETLIQGQKELRFSVKRMTKGRVVKIKMPG